MTLGFPLTTLATLLLSSSFVLGGEVFGCCGYFPVCLLVCLLLLLVVVVVVVVCVCACVRACMRACVRAETERVTCAH